MPIGTIESKNQVDYKLVYGRADGMPNILESMVVCRSRLGVAIYVLHGLAKPAHIDELEWNKWHQRRAAGVGGREIGRTGISGEQLTVNRVMD
jgi:hypothetical protein